MFHLQLIDLIVYIGCIQKIIATKKKVVDECLFN